MMNEKKFIGLYLIFDAIVSIYYANIGNITLKIAMNFEMISQSFRIVRGIIGAYLLLSDMNKVWNSAYYKYHKLIGVYLIIDAIVSIIVAREFNSWDDWLRISRAFVGWRIFNVQ